MEIEGVDSKKCCLDLNLWKQLGDFALCLAQMYQGD